MFSPEKYSISKEDNGNQQGYALFSQFSDEDDDVLSDEPDFLGAGYENRPRRASRVSFSEIVVVNEHGVGLYFVAVLK